MVTVPLTANRCGLKAYITAFKVEIVKRNMMLVSNCIVSKYNLLTDRYFLSRDLVHRQTASAVVQHMSLGVYGFGCEDSLNHLLNYVWPNVFETSPHVIQAVMGALEGLRVAIGPCRMLQYCLQVCPNVCWDSKDSSCHTAFTSEDKKSAQGDFQQRKTVWLLISLKHLIQHPVPMTLIMAT